MANHRWLLGNQIGENQKHSMLNSVTLLEKYEWKSKQHKQIFHFRALFEFT